jgi:hypothetical protein
MRNGGSRGFAGEAAGGRATPGGTCVAIPERHEPTDGSEKKGSDRMPDNKNREQEQQRKDRNQKNPQKNDQGDKDADRDQRDNQRTPQR